MAEKETEKLRDRVSRARRTVARAGLPASGPATWGYSWRLPVDEQEARRHKVGTGSEVRRILDVNEDEAPSVREFFARFAAGEGTHSVMAWLAGLPAKARGGRSLSRVRAVDILRNPTYIARRVHPQVLAEEGIACETPEDILALPKSDHWPALIADETWLAVQRRLGDPKQTHRGRTATHLLTRLARCPQCEGRSTMVASPSKVSGRTYPAYRCTSRELGAGRANRRCSFSVPAAVFEAAVLEQVGSVVDALTTISPDLMPEVRRAWTALQRENQGAGDEREAEVTRLQHRLGTIKRALAEALAKKLAGEQEEEEYEGAAAILREKRKELEAQLASLGAATATAPAADAKAPLPDLDTVLTAAGSWAHLLREGSVEEQRVVLLELVEAVIPHRTGHGKYTVEVQWAEDWDALREIGAAL